jgi:thiamine-phosphate pyrophosphorylase
LAGIDYTLYLVTDRSLLDGRDIMDEVRKAVQGGVTIVQLREKEASSREFYQLAGIMHDYLREINIPLIINDRLDIALAVDAEGLHIGQDDIPLAAARRLLGKDKIIGLSVETLEQARQGEREGADYLGVGPVYYTATKKDINKPLGLEFLSQCRQNTSIPLVAIGGISSRNLAQVKRSGVNGAAVVSAILGNADVEKAARELSEIWKNS